MSETTTPPETEYEALSEATDNDVRVALPEGVDGEGTPPDTEVAETPEVAVEASEAAVEPSEADDDDKAKNARLAKLLREEKRRARQLELHSQALAGQRQESRDETIEREIQMRASQMAQADTINKRANEIYSEGVKQFGRVEFDDAVKHVNETFGAMMPLVIDTLTDLDMPQRLIQHLSENPDVCDDLASLPPHKLGAALAKQAAKLNAPKPRALSKAPDPIRPIATVSTAEPEMDIEKMSMEQLDAMWTKRDFQKRMQ